MTFTFAQIKYRAIAGILWLASAYALWSFLGALWAPAACADVDHGSFDYRTWQCSQEQQAYIDVAFYNTPGFWLAFSSLLVAMGYTAWKRYGSPSRS